MINDDKQAFWHKGSCEIDQSQYAGCGQKNVVQLEKRGTYKVNVEHCTEYDLIRI